MAKCDIVVIGGSAGGVEALLRLAKALPGDLPAALFVVLHFHENHGTVLPQLLSHAGPLPGVLATDGAPIEPGRFYVAPPGFHLLLGEKGMNVMRGPRENRFRPSIDVLFRSAAVVFGPRTVGVILSGTMDDGKAGMEAIRRANGRTLMQSPEDSLFPQLPLNTLKAIPIEHCLPVPGLARMLAEVVREESRPAVPALADLAKEIRMIHESGDHMRLVSEIGKLVPLKCPDCGGALWEIQQTALLRFRCHLGHAFSAESLGSGTEQDTEKALLQAVELMKEQTALYEDLAGRAKLEDPGLAARFEAKSKRSRAQAEVLEKLVKEYPSPKP